MAVQCAARIVGLLATTPAAILFDLGQAGYEPTQPVILQILIIIPSSLLPSSLVPSSKSPLSSVLLQPARSSPLHFYLPPLLPAHYFALSALPSTPATSRNPRSWLPSVPMTLLLSSNIIPVSYLVVSLAIPIMTLDFSSVKEASIHQLHSYLLLLPQCTHWQHWMTRISASLFLVGCEGIAHTSQQPPTSHTPLIFLLLTL